MKNAYVDISLEGLADLLRLSFDPNRCEITRFEQSPKYENCVHLHITGPYLPIDGSIDGSDDPQPVKLNYSKDWIEKEVEGKTYLVQEYTLTIEKPHP